ncbi:hypothetical protein ACIGXI_28000 [Kitasatospora aureofaciens]|uniref:hypothetical protein n=1 Tax=Kitasatospora aureofaciens TaxID=1894 RepID=UPI0037CAAA29
MDDDHGGTGRAMLEDWLEDLPLLVARLERVHLTDGPALDYGPGSLAALEQALLAEPGGPDEDFTRAAAGYLGEVLLVTGGGRWGVDDTGPVVLPDPALGLAPLSVGTLVDAALAEAGGEVFGREHSRLAAAVAAVRAERSDWTPHKEVSPLDPIGPQSDDPALAAWLRERRAAFPAWADQLPGGRSAYDFSPAGLDALEREVRRRYPAVDAFDAEATGPFPSAPFPSGSFPTSPFLAGAVWYLGEVVCLRCDSVWLHWPVDPAAEPGSHHHPDNPWSGIPFTHQPHRRDAQAFNPLAELRGLVRYGDGYHLRNVLPSAR